MVYRMAKSHPVHLGAVAQVAVGQSRRTSKVSTAHCWTSIREREIGGGSQTACGTGVWLKPGGAFALTPQITWISWGGGLGPVVYSFQRPLSWPISGIWGLVHCQSKLRSEALWMGMHVAVVVVVLQFHEVGEVTGGYFRRFFCYELFLRYRRLFIDIEVVFLQIMMIP